MLKKKILITTISLILLVTAFSYSSYNKNEPKLFSVQDSIVIRIDGNASGKWTYLSNDNTWLLNGIHIAKIYTDKSYTMRCNLTGQVENCPVPNVKYDRNKPMRLGAVGTGKKTIVLYDDFEQSIYVYDRNSCHNIRKIKPDFKNKRYWGNVIGYNTIETNDTLAIIMLSNTNSSENDTNYTKNKLFNLFDLKKGKTITTFGRYDEIYSKKNLCYLKYSRFCTNFENNQFFYHLEGSPYIYEYNLKTGKEKQFGIPVQGYFIPSHSMPDSIQQGTIEWLKLFSKYASSCYLNQDIYYDKEHKFLYRTTIKPIGEKDNPIHAVLQVYDVATYKLIKEIDLPENMYFISYANGREVWIQKTDNNQKEHISSVVIYKYHF